MIETICPNCGNRKSFEDSHVGKTFKCPSCTNPVTIQNVGSQLNTEPVSQTNSFADEITRAEEQKKYQEEEDRKKAAIEANNKKIKKYLIYSILAGIYSIGCLSSYSDHHGSTSLILFILSACVAIYFYNKRKKMKNGEA